MLQNSDFIHEMYFFVMKRFLMITHIMQIFFTNEKYINKFQISVFVVIYLGTYYNSSKNKKREK